MFLNGEFQETIDSCTAILRGDSSETWVWFILGQSQKALLQYDNALESLEKARIYQPEYIPLLQALGGTWSALGNHRKALEIFQHILVIDSTQIHARIESGHALQKQNRHQEALGIFQELVLQDPSQYAYHKELGMAYLKADSLKKAAWFLHNALNINSNDQNLVSQLATLYNNREDHALALNVVQLGLRHDTMALSLRALEAYCHYLLEKPDTAALLFERVHEMGDSSMFTTKYYALSLLELERFEEALPLLHRVFNNDTTIAQHCYYIASAQYGLQNYDSARTYYQQTIQILKPPPRLEATIYRDLGRTETYLGKYTDALNYYQSSLNLDPDAYEALFYIGSLYDYRLDNKQLAMDYYQKFLDQSEFDPEALNEDEGGKITLPKAAYHRIVQIREDLHFEGTLKKDQ